MTIGIGPERPYSRNRVGALVGTPTEHRGVRKHMFAGFRESNCQMWLAVTIELPGGPEKRESSDCYSLTDQNSTGLLGRIESRVHEACLNAPSSLSRPRATERLVAWEYVANVTVRETDQGNVEIEQVAQ